MATIYQARTRWRKHPVPVHIRTVMDIQDAGQLKKEQQKILQDLHEMGLQGPVSSALQTRYNQIIDHQSEPSFPDPLRVLPPETCTQIFWEIIREEHPGNQLESLLLLSSVSTNWCHYLTSVSSFWREIWLCPRTEDNLVKVVTSLTLSRGCEIKLDIGSPLHSTWEAYTEALLPHASRITTITVQHERNFPFIESLGNLPALEQIRVPSGFDALRDVEMEKRFSLLMDNAPSLISPLGLILTADILRHPRATKFIDIDTRLSFSELLCILGANQTASQSQLPVKNLNFHSSFTDVNVKEIPKITLDLDRVGLFQSSPGYVDLFNDYFQSIGTLIISVFSDDVLGQLFVSLGSCSRITKLDITIPNTVRSVPDRHDYPVLSSLNQLFIKSEHYFDRLDPSFILEKIAMIMPSLQYINIFGQISIQEKGFHPLGQFKDLQQLHISSIMDSIQVKDLVYFDHVEILRLETDTLQDYCSVQFSKLRSLRTTTLLSQHTAFEPPRVFPVSYAIPPSSFGTLVELYILIILPVRLQLGLLPLLEDITLGQNMMGTWGGDILEQIIITPKICPKLRIIRCSERVAEWDIIFLMLLRRNFLHDQTVRKIWGIHLSTLAPPALLLPLSQLLRGRFVPNLDLGAFSLDRITQFFFQTPSDSPRCERCSFMLKKECLRTAGYDHDIMYPWLMPTPWTTAVEGGWEYQLVNAVPDPPLPEYMERWLAQKWDRRRAFIAAGRDAERRGQKMGVCSSYTSPAMVTGYTMEDRSIDVMDESTSEAMHQFFTSESRLGD
ncbi:hypothetical protein FRB91_006648 [Serendipita sp. 411]|nr:hypothetical protein FRB91_006648 [Serendipita sp. 411]